MIEIGLVVFGAVMLYYSIKLLIAPDEYFTRIVEKLFS